MRLRLLFWAVFGGTLAADLLTKWAAFRFLRVGQAARVIGGFFDLQPVWNEGIVFGLPAPVPVTVGISVVAAGVVFWYLSTRQGLAPMVQVYLAFILSGVVGNLCDRVVFGAVRDFVELYIEFGGGRRSWPNFNLADAFILVGVGLAMIEFVWAEDSGKAKPCEGEKRSCGELAGKGGEQG